MVFSGPYVIVSVTQSFCELLVLDLLSLSSSIFSISCLSEAHPPYPVRTMWLLNKRMLTDTHLILSLRHRTYCIITLSSQILAFSSGSLVDRSHMWKERAYSSLSSVAACGFLELQVQRWPTLGKQRQTLFWLSNRLKMVSLKFKNHAVFYILSSYGWF